MKLSRLTALSPLDGRYSEKTEDLREFFSEYALMQYRVFVEIRWFLYLHPDLSLSSQQYLNNLFRNFNEKDAENIKHLEQTTNHDVKAIEYFIKEKISSQPELKKLREWVHFGCTSEDINNLAYGLMLKSAQEKILLPCFQKIIEKLRKFSHHYAHVPMLSRTHGQKASPTTVGKEFANVVSRLNYHLSALSVLKFYGKMNGAVGNFNAHRVVFPKKNWPKLCQKFVESLGLSYQAYTTQIEPHDYLAAFFHNIIRIHYVLTDFCRDSWGYISLGYFTQKMQKNETGSSTMPHKVNPIDFENAEGNFYLSNSLLSCLAEKLSLSRFQRDLVDSTLLRNIGSAMGHAVIAYQALLRGLDKININQSRIKEDLENSWELLAEPLQMMMRAEGIENAYEQLKLLTRGKENITQQDLHQFINTLPLTDKVKQQLKDLTPLKYIGYAKELAETC